MARQAPVHGPHRTGEGTGTLHLGQRAHKHGATTRHGTGGPDIGHPFYTGRLIGDPSVVGLAGRQGRPSAAAGKGESRLR